MSQDDPIVGVGHPDFQQLLSADDEKRVDEKGRPIADNHLWSKSGTGLYVCIMMTQGPVLVDRRYDGAVKVIHGNTRLAILGTLGKPVIGVDYVGACIEVPSDLAQDATKRQYITEWIVHTTLECGEHHKVPRYVLERNTQWICDTIEEALRSHKL